jgi:hypothetical protein
MPERLRNMFSGGSIPSWVINVLLGVLFSIMLTWSGAITKTTIDNAKEISAQTERNTSVKESITEIKDSQRRVEDKLDRVLLKEAK